MYWRCQQINCIQNAVVGGWAFSQTAKDYFQVLNILISSVDLHL